MQRYGARRNLECYKREFEQLEENNSYEFTFRGEAENNKDYSKLYDIVNDFECVEVNETNKTGLEQRQDAIVNEK